MDISPNGQFAYETVRLLDTSPTTWIFRLYTTFRRRLATVHECHRQTDRTGQDRTRTDNIGRTVLQTVAQKWLNRDAVWNAESGWPKEPRIRWGTDLLVGNIEGKGMTFWRQLCTNSWTDQNILWSIAVECGLGWAKKTCIRWGPDPHAKGNFGGKSFRRHSAVSCAKMVETIEMSFGLWIRVGPRKHVVDGIS